ncbi:DUF1800 family protein [Poseidonocella sp. HB161398]|uniref:DUF1800 domain-containing protein n=1 Tax=Poseidonocella sp. HB161398 TaxID=2320855 RepID=UPI001F1051DE|nr:DUF1800 domain-containing protein [Poseidonocella sp. HB161398]
MFQPHLAAIRFGTGRSPVHPDPQSADSMLAALAAEDPGPAAFPVSPMSDAVHWVAPYRELQKARRNGKNVAADMQEMQMEIRKAERTLWIQGVSATLARGIAAEDGFRDRLALFWADHFTVAGRGVFLKQRADTFVDEAIRPHVGGRFADMLKAAELHPVMLRYLDQIASIGPESKMAQNRPAGRGGLNENLGRELLELHTLGVNGSYGQADVRQMAELLAGVTMNQDLEMVFLRSRAEPGAEHVAGFSSSADKDRLKDVLDALDYLAVHPDTAAHLSRKLAVHFVSDTPDEDLVAAMTARYAETGGDLAQVYDAMLSHPAAWAPELQKVKRPVDFVISGLRALGADPAALPAQARETPKLVYRDLLNPMRFMGQSWNDPDGPNGWPEEAEAWVTASALSERMKWAMRAATMAGVPEMAEPVALVETALGPLAGEQVRFAAGAAETRREGIGLVLVSPEFQRR